MGQPGTSRRLPTAVVKETLNGRPLYYLGFQAVLDRQKTIEEIMGSSGLQSAIVTYLLETLLSRIDKSVYKVLTNEVGSHIDKNNNFSFDIAVFERSRLVPEKITTKYTDVPPKIVLEVDLDVDLQDSGLAGVEEYIFLKTQKLFDFGTERVIWVLTRPAKVMVATHGEPWQVIDWRTSIEIMPGIEFNVAQYLEAEGIAY
jgi:Uma2 family endonuclease